ncbi:MAG: 30S ribosomal protein S16 [Bacteroidales bacterium]|nr:30S ribosomal protein S16 [Bacteroidales bacterium]
MPAKIRLTRQGRKKRPIYHIVVADSRAPRDGRYIERLGQYNPNTNPATIDLDFDKALDWLQKGAQPTDTCKAILSYRGVLMKKHLLDGVRKGAFNEEEAEARFDKWLKEKEAKIQAKTDSVTKAKEADEKQRLEAEIKIKEARAEEIAKKRAAEAESEAKAAKAEEAEADVEENVEVAEVADTDNSAEEAVAEEPKAEEPKAEEVSEPEASEEEEKTEE